LVIAGGTPDEDTKNLTEQMRIARNGYIGMGTIHPTTKLDVNGTVNATNFTLNGVPLTTDVTPWTTTDNDLNYGGGNVGIGIAVPTEKLEVVGNIKATGNITATTVDATNFTVGGLPLPSSPWDTSGNGIKYTNGNIGIGNVAPEFALDIKRTTNGKKMLRLGSNNGNDLSFDVAAGQGLANIVAGGKYNTNANNYIYTGTRGSSRVQFLDGNIQLLVGDKANGQATAGDIINYKPRLIASINNLIFKSNDYRFNDENNQSWMTLKSGNVLIGTGTISPNSKLDVKGTINATSFTMNGVPIQEALSSLMSNSEGKIEIGKDDATTHEELLEVNGSATFNNDLHTTQLTQVSINTNTKVAHAALTVAGPTFIGSWKDTGDGDHVVAQALNSEAKDHYSLFVSKGIVTERFRQFPNENWRDDVFKEGYKMPTLTEIESFIQANKHLPGVISEKEVNTKGYDLHDMNVTFIEKIEHLYLYSIAQEKEVKKQKEEIEILKRQVSRIDRLESLLKEIFEKRDKKSKTNKQ
jgi:hypothetical protein